MQFTVTQHGDMKLASVNELLDQGWLVESFQHVINALCEFNGSQNNGIAGDSKAAMFESWLDDCGETIPSIGTGGGGNLPARGGIPWARKRTLTWRLSWLKTSASALAPVYVKPIRSNIFATWEALRGIPGSSSHQLKIRCSSG